MKGKSAATIAFFMFVAGIVLIVFHNHPGTLAGISVFIGIMLILPGLLNVATAAFSRKAEKKGDKGSPHRARYIWGLVASIFCIALGVAMIVAAGIFVNVLVYVFAAILIAVGFYHLLVIGIFSRPFVLPWYFYIIPVLMIVAGCMMIFWTVVRTASAVFLLMTGIAFVCSAVNALMEHVGTRHARFNSTVQRIAEGHPAATAASEAPADPDSETTNE